MKTVLIFPMMEEALHLLTKLNLLDKVSPPQDSLNAVNAVTPISFYYNGVDVDIYLCGAGKVLSSISATAAILSSNPDLLILAGSACGLGEMPIGALYAPSLVHQTDFQFDRPLETPISPTFEEVLNKVNSKHNAAVNVRSVGLTGDTFLEGTEEKLRLANNFGASTYDMETAAVAASCSALGAKFYAIRSVSDNLYGDFQAFEKNLPFVSEILAEAVFGILDVIGSSDNLAKIFDKNP